MSPPPDSEAPRSLWSQIAAFDYVFWLCIFMELMERMAYYGVRLVVPVFMVLAQAEGGPGLSHTEKGWVLAAWAAMQSWLPTFAGGFSDRYGYKRTIAISVLLKTAGYFAMSEATGFWTMVLGTQLLAAGTGLFKPGIQGTMAHSIAKSPGTASMGWGLFYQSVNVGAAVSAYIPMYTRDIYGWSSVFLACSGIVLSNLIPLFFYQDPKDERQTTQDARGIGALLRDSVRDLFTSPVLLGFIFISAGFWFSFHQLFDMLPNYVDDWTDSSVLLSDAGRLLGVEAWEQAGRAGEMVPQERLLNINALMIMFTMFLFAWLSSRLRVLTSIMLGMLLASGAFVLFIGTADVYVILLGVAVFTVGEMLCSPKRQEYMASLAPPGKRALYLGYANMPDGIGWVAGNLFAGASYEEHGDKINLARRFLATQSNAADGARAWLDRMISIEAHSRTLPPAEAAAWLEQQGTSTAALTETVEHTIAALGLPTSTSAADALLALQGKLDMVLFAEILPRGEVLHQILALVPVLPDGSATTLATLRDYLFATYQPGQVWYLFVVISFASVVMMVFYDRWIRSKKAA